MSRESKIIETSIGRNSQQIVYDYECFGWELLSLDKEQIVFSRETQNPVYPQLLKHQLAYEEKVNERNALLGNTFHQKLYNVKLALFLFVLAVVPFILYTVFYYKKKKELDAARNANSEKIAAIEAEMKRITEESRAIFFSKQS